MFSLKTDFSPCGDQPQAIKQLVAGFEHGKPSQVLLGVTGSGKTYTMAQVVAQLQKPTLVMAHNKTLAAQLYQEFRAFFPNNAVEYFVSYYDYYQPEAYIARTDTYIEKDMAINDQIDRLRLSATRSLLERKDVLIVASISCIYGLGMPEYYAQMRLVLERGKDLRRDELMLHLVEMQYKRGDFDFIRGRFRVRGDTVDIFPSYEDSLALRITFFGDTIEEMQLIDPLTTRTIDKLHTFTLYPGSHHVTPEGIRLEAMRRIRAEMEEQVLFFESQSRWIEAQRIRERTQYDLEYLKEIGFCKGIENYSRHFSNRNAGEPPTCLLDYFPSDYLLIVDESHQTLPQIHAMCHGDQARKQSLVDFGFRLPSAYDNRPLRFEEWYNKLNQVLYVSATPAKWEMEEVQGAFVEQVVRPTGLLDPPITVRPANGQVDDCISAIREEVALGGRILVTTLTKKLSEELTGYLTDIGIKAKYLHSDVDTIERMQILQDLRLGLFDTLVGINLLREGLDLPEVSLVVILDADKEGFLRSSTALIQTCGRAARNIRGHVIMYADRETKSIAETLQVTDRRRAIQMQYNETHGITPQSVQRKISPLLKELEQAAVTKSDKKRAKDGRVHMTQADVRKQWQTYEKEMRRAAKELHFEEATHFRDLMHQYQQLDLTFSDS